MATASHCIEALRQLHAGDDPLSPALVGALLQEAAADPDAALPFAALLTLWSKRGETGEEIAAGAQFMRDNAIPIELDDEDAIDVCGTGGTHKSLLNCSTTASLLLASMEVSVAKHGNHSVTRSSGSADFFSAAGIPLALAPEGVSRAIAACKIAFIYARAFHPIMANIAPVRAAIGVRTVFNLLGPLSNPARVQRQLIGVSQERLMQPIAEALQILGTKRALVVWSEDGLDEVSPSAPTHIREVSSTGIESYVFEPQSCQVSHETLEGLSVDSPQASVNLAQLVLEGKETGIAHDYVALNAGFGLYVAGATTSIEAGVEAASAALHSGTAANMLSELKGALTPDS